MEMDKMLGPKTDKPTTKIGHLASRIDENNDTLIEVRNALRDFVDRTCGESLESSPETDSAPVAPGMLADIDNRLVRQSKLLGEMNDAVSAINKIA